MTAIAEGPADLFGSDGLLRPQQRPDGRCTAGHELTKENVRWRTAEGRLRWSCRTCTRAGEQARADRDRAARALRAAEADDLRARVVTVPDAPEGLPRHWRDGAACRAEDPELHFPVGTTGPALRQIAEAKAVCRRCPVVSECLAWALETGQDDGIWGGLSEDERRALKKKPRRTS